MPPPARHRLAVVALFAPMPVGTSIPRREWPAHVTLAGNFATDAALAAVVSAVESAGPPSESLHVRIGEEARFGRRRDIRVRLVVAPAIHRLHEQLADRLESLAGFAPDEPEFWRAGYRPHVTLTAGVALHEDADEVIRGIAVVELDESTATVIAAFGPSPADS